MILTMLLIFCISSTVYLVVDRAFRWSWLYLPATMLGYLLAVFLASGWPTSAPLPNPAVVFSAVPGAGVVASSTDRYAPRFYGIEVPPEVMDALSKAEGSPVVVSKDDGEDGYKIQLPGELVKKSGR